MDHKISVIIPVYNVERYLKRCVESVLNQTYANLEILLIDDGSTDRSPLICDTYAQISQQVKVFHMKNGGVSKARNIGLQMSQGEYCMFVDSDDYIETNYIENLYNDIVTNDVEVVCGGCVVVENGVENRTIPCKQIEKTITSREALFSEFDSEEYLFGVVWAKLFKTSFARQVCFSEMEYGEDTVFMIELFFHNPKVHINACNGYFYVKRQDSVMGASYTRGAKKEIDRILIGKALVKFGKVANDLVWQRYVNYYASYICDALSKLVILKEHETYFKYRDFLKNSITDVFAYKEIISKKTRYMLECYYYFPSAFWYVKQLFHRIKYNI